ncbi:hypothetical protein ACFQI7_18690 [Paenibacillus allorhizosphaerae]|uniref:FAD-dependent oxidoreductase n=1 Tax=Paenibacillus allorhizosphaerae TaxID=2849866 RepID=A0ABN7TKX3_9BACL|nr:hypothetical protein [Paenibacillus allorhizosphaerae]CAG7634149.1 hypothetical protein PAECIP111802_02019 [Paenibacillus allorhizosphaerae]
MLQSHYPVLVYGATFAGLGIAAALKDRALVAERSALVGHEFIAAYHSGESWAANPLHSTAAKDLRTELASRNLLSENGGVHLPAMAPVLFHRIRKLGLQATMMTEIVDVKVSKKGYDVTLFNASGLQQVTVDHLIDTTSTCLSDSSHPVSIESKSIHAMLHSQTPAPVPSLPPGDEKRVRFVKGLMPGELILELSLHPSDGWTEARTELHRYWEQRYEAFAPWTLAAVADAFAIRTAGRERSVGPDWSWFPSSNWANGLQAFDAGYSKGCHLHETILSA